MDQGRVNLDIVDGLVDIRRQVRLNEKKMSSCLLEWIGEIGSLIKKTIQRVSNVQVLLPTRFKLTAVMKKADTIFIRVEAAQCSAGEVTWISRNQLEMSGIRFDIQRKPRYTLGFITFQTKVHSCVSR